jgi:hypothetical protein
VTLYFPPATVVRLAGSVAVAHQSRPAALVSGRGIPAITKIIRLRPGADETIRMSRRVEVPRPPHNYVPQTQATLKVRSAPLTENHRSKCRETGAERAPADVSSASFHNRASKGTATDGETRLPRTRSGDCHGVLRRRFHRYDFTITQKGPSALLDSNRKL